MSFIKDGCSFSKAHFPMLLGSKMLCHHRKARNKLFLCLLFFTNKFFIASSSLSSSVQKLQSNGIIGWKDSHLEFIFSHHEKLRLHCMQDAAEAMRSQSGKGSGYCYVIEPGPKTCVFGQLTGLLFCFYVKILFGFQLQVCRLLKQYFLLCTRFWAGR